MEAKAYLKDKEIDLNPFVEKYIAAIFTAAAMTLKGVEDQKVLEFIISGRDIKIIADEDEVEFFGFAEVIITDTLTATLQHLRGFPTDDEIKIIVER
jgi:hypothetical protein